MRALGFQADAGAVVLSRAQRALDIGCDGVISSGLEAERLRKALGPNFLVVVPGIRPVANKDDQRSEEHTSELQSLMRISYAVFCLKKKKKKQNRHINKE